VDNASGVDATSLVNRSGGAGVPAGRKPIIWVHIHKAAGTFMCWLASRAGESVVRPNANCNWNVYDGVMDTGPRASPPTCLSRTHYFESGGYTYGQVERELKPADLGCAGFNYGVLLREPIDLIHSTLQFEAANYGGAGKGVLNQLLHQLKAPRPCYSGQPTGQNKAAAWKTLDNFQVRLLANAFHVPAGQLAQEHLDQARKRLDTFQVVARVEDLATRGAEMFGALRWPSYLSSHIRTKKNSAAHDWLHITADEAAWLRKVNHLDIQLFNEVAGRPYATMTG